MAIPNRTSITCPACGAHEDVVIADTSVGPQGRTSDTSSYMMFNSPRWTQTRRAGETYLSCVTCGQKDIATLTKLAEQN